jgi:hypothetical protein
MTSMRGASQFCGGNFLILILILPVIRIQEVKEQREKD